MDCTFNFNRGYIHQLSYLPHSQEERKMLFSRWRGNI